MLRNIILGLISTHMEVKAYSLFEGGQISALMTVAGIDKLWIEQHVSVDEDGNQVTTFKIDTKPFLIWQIAKFKKMIDKLNNESLTWSRCRYIDVKFMIPVRDSKEIEALA